MSITFTPTAGVVTTYNYYVVDPRERLHAGDDVANGVIRFAQDEPSLNMANDNALFFIKRLAMTHHEDPEPYIGSYPQESIDELITRINDALEVESRDDMGEPSYRTQRLNELMGIALHCKYHGCGFTWA